LLCKRDFAVFPLTLRAMEHTQIKPNAPTSSVRFGALAVGAAAVGALAIGAVAVGVVAISRLTIRRLRLDGGYVKELHIERLTIGDLQSNRSDSSGSP
jgi:hypothetical protein